MAETHIELDQAAITRLLHGEGARQARMDGAERVERLWRANVHPKTGMTDILLHVADGEGPGEIGTTYILTGPAGPGAHDRLNQSAWLWLEYGTSKMRAEMPARRALNEAAIE